MFYNELNDNLHRMDEYVHYVNNKLEHLIDEVMELKLYKIQQEQLNKIEPIPFI